MIKIPKWKLDTCYSDNVKRIVFETPSAINGGVLKVTSYIGKEMRGDCFHLSECAAEKASRLKPGDQIQITECAWDDESSPETFYICDFLLIG